MATSTIIMNSRSHPGDSSKEIIKGEKFAGDGFYGRSDGFHTVQYNLTRFIGNVVIQATLSTQPEEKDWFTLPETRYVLSSEDKNANGSFVYNFTGNYVWVRAVATYVNGTINKVLMNH